VDVKRKAHNFCWPVGGRAGRGGASDTRWSTGSMSPLFG